MKICLVNPPSPFLLNEKIFPPLGLLYLASAIREYNPVVIDIGAGDKIPESFDVYGISCNITQSSWVRQNKHLFTGYTIIGGPYVSIVKETMGYDCAVVGEGEISLNYLLKNKIYGIYPQVNSPLNVNNILFPARDLIDIHRYKYYLDGRKTTTMVTSRGCPYKCAFCSKGIWKNVGFRSVENVLKEAKEIKDIGFDGLMIYDDCFTLNEKRVVKICDGLKDMDFRWACFGRANMKENLLEYMKDSGCVRISFGIESGSQKILDNVNKKTTVTQNTTIIKKCNEIGIKTRAFLIIGLPGETRETVDETKKWLREAQPTNFGMGIFMPYPSSPIYEHSENYDIKIYKTDLFNMWYRGVPGQYNCFVSTSALNREDIIELREEISKEFKELEKYKEYEKLLEKK